MTFNFNKYEWKTVCNQIKECKYKEFRNIQDLELNEKHKVKRLIKLKQNIGLQLFAIKKNKVHCLDLFWN